MNANSINTEQEKKGSLRGLLLLLIAALVIMVGAGVTAQAISYEETATSLSDIYQTPDDSDAIQIGSYNIDYKINSPQGDK